MCCFRLPNNMNTPFLYPIKDVYDFVPHDYDAIIAKQMDLGTVRFGTVRRFFHSFTLACFAQCQPLFSVFSYYYAILHR